MIGLPPLHCSPEGYPRFTMNLKTRDWLRSRLDDGKVGGTAIQENAEINFNCYRIFG